MKLTNREINSFFESPPNSIAGVLIYGSDYMRVADKRQKLIQSLLGPKADEEMRLSRISKDNFKIHFSLESRLQITNFFDSFIKKFN